MVPVMQPPFLFSVHQPTMLTLLQIAFGLLGSFCRPYRNPSLQCSQRDKVREGLVQLGWETRESELLAPAAYPHRVVLLGLHA